MLHHTFHLLQILEWIEQGQWEAFTSSRKSEKEAEEITRDNFMKYTELFHALTHDDPMRRGQIYLIGLLHDWGSIVDFKDHERLSADLIERRLSALAYQSLKFFNTACIRGTVAVAKDHVILGTVYMRDRTPGYVEKRVQDPEVLKMLTLVTFCDAGSLRKGIWLTNKKVEFYMDIHTPGVLQALAQDFVRLRLHGYVANARGQSTGRDEEIDRIYQNLTFLYGEKSKILFDQCVGETPEVIDYGLPLFQALSSENIIKLLLLITHVVEFEKVNPKNFIYWIQFPSKVDIKQWSQLLDRYSWGELSETSLVALYQAQPGQMKQVYGMQFDAKEGRLEIDVVPPIPAVFNPAPFGVILKAV